jgi:hypothetical protein
MTFKNYSQRIKTYGVEGDITMQEHLGKFIDFINLEEFDYEDVKKILFPKKNSGDVKKWFRGLPSRSIQNCQEFEKVFIRKWEDEKNTLQLLTQYTYLKRDPTETMKKILPGFEGKEQAKTI